MILFFVALVIAVLFSTVAERTADKPTAVQTGSNSGPSQLTVVRPTTSAPRANTSSMINPALQMPGLPNSRAEQSAAESASRAADAAAALAAAPSSSSQ